MNGDDISVYRKANTKLNNLLEYVYAGHGCEGAPKSEFSFQTRYPGEDFHGCLSDGLKMGYNWGFPRKHHGFLTLNSPDKSMCKSKSPVEYDFYFNKACLAVDEGWYMKFNIDDCGTTKEAAIEWYNVTGCPVSALTEIDHEPQFKCKFKKCSKAVCFYVVKMLDKFLFLRSGRCGGTV